MPGRLLARVRAAAINIGDSHLEKGLPHSRQNPHSRCLPSDPHPTTNTLVRASMTYCQLFEKHVSHLGKVLVWMTSRVTIFGLKGCSYPFRWGPVQVILSTPHNIRHGRLALFSGQVAGTFEVSAGLALVCHD